MASRFHRRTAILRGKRKGVFNRDQYYLEGARRTRAARSLRVFLCRNEPVLLETPRWSRPLAFLEEVATDLSMGSPAIELQAMVLHSMADITHLQSWRALAERVLEISGPGGTGPAPAAFARNDFAGAVQSAFARGQRSRCLVMCGVEHLPAEVLRDLLFLIEALEEPSMNIVLAGDVDVTRYGLTRIRPLHLPDFGAEETLEALVEQIGPVNVPRLRALGAVSGGVPAIIHAIGARNAEPQLRSDASAVWTMLGDLAAEFTSHWRGTTADALLRARLALLLQDGAQPFHIELDPWLLRAGLVRQVGEQTEIRAPIFRMLS